MNNKPMGHKLVSKENSRRLTNFTKRRIGRKTYTHSQNKIYFDWSVYMKFHQLICDEGWKHFLFLN